MTEAKPEITETREGVYDVHLGDRFIGYLLSPRADWFDAMPFPGGEPKQGFRYPHQAADWLAREYRRSAAR